MSASKLTFNLVYMGRVGHSVEAYAVYYRVISMDTRFVGCRYRSSNGWVIQSDATPALDLTSKIIYLHGRGDTQRQCAGYIINSCFDSEEQALSRIQSLLDALQEWSVHCPQICTDLPTGSDVLSPEVRESLIYAELEEGEPADGEAPIYVDMFNPPNIAV